jgi:nucleoside 2-deoxyribosyltransferase
MTEFYQSKIKPSIESLGMVVHKADELKNANFVMQDIWKSICEARIVLADLTGFNANVMYELGIAHTVGKDTVIIYQNKQTRLVDSHLIWPYSANCASQYGSRRRKAGEGS